MKFKIFCFFLFLLACTTHAKIKLPNLLCDNAVLQQESQVIMWGHSTMKKVEISTSWSDKIYTVTVSADGTWSIPIPTPKASFDAHSITFDDGEPVTINNILIGELWLTSGQSNMKLALQGNPSQPIIGAAQAIMKARREVPIRFFTVEEKSATEPQSDCVGEWKENLPENVASASATAYFFAQYMFESLGLPIGIVNCSWGGSTIESWMSRETLLSFNKDYDFSKIAGGNKSNLAQRVQTNAYNGMLSGLKNLQFRGMLWYQGEANRPNYQDYPELFSCFASAVRSHFDCGEFPIFYAQIAPFGIGDDLSGALMRESQAKIMSKVENTGMVVLSDIGEERCIHPRHKREVGTRFAYWALAQVYGFSGIEYRAPEFSELIHLNRKNNTEEGAVGLRFNYAEFGLSLATEQMSRNFEVAGADGVFYPAQMRIVFKKKHHIEVWSDKVSDIKEVRYGFKNYFKGDVYNNFGIPISSFRTDN